MDEESLGRNIRIRPAPWYSQQLTSPEQDGEHSSLHFLKNLLTHLISQSTGACCYHHPLFNSTKASFSPCVPNCLRPESSLRLTVCLISLRFFLSFIRCLPLPPFDDMNMDMSGMTMGEGMDMGSDGLFKTTNMAIARLYWYLIAGCVGLLALRRFVAYRRRVWGYVRRLLAYPFVNIARFADDIEQEEAIQASPWSNSVTARESYCSDV
jgi:hypothetical protein